MKALRALIPGVIQDSALYRTNNAARQRADAEYRAVRSKVMDKQDWRCQFCGLVSKSNECHHIDGNHANNEPDNFVAADTLCHAYHHVGHASGSNQFAPDNLGSKMVLAAVPELSGADLNLLQRAIGVAMLDPDEEAMATRMHRLISSRVEPVQESFGTFRGNDFARAMATLNADEYGNRIHVIEALRLVFHKEVLKNEGRKFLKDFSSLPFKSWESVSKNARHKRSP